MTVILNNVPAEVPDGCTVAQLAEVQQLPAAGVAVAVNDRLVRRNSWDSHILSPGDRIVLIKAAYGG